MGNAGRVRLLLHAVAFGNLKLLAPHDPKDHARKARQKISEYADISTKTMDQSVSQAFDDGCDALFPLVDPPAYDTRNFLEKDDFSHTLQAMGSNIVEWVQDIFHRRLFAEDARVLSLTSEGNSVAWRGYAAVAAAKAVLESVSRAMAVEFAPFGVRVNVIQAGVTETAALSAIPGNRQIRANAALRNPLGRLTRPADVANVIFLLCQDEAAWINGALIRVDGGESIA
jgi:NAD(P)-dependent dehydrogenase (short-subunit alcohol dehydrogenase family)